MKIQAKKFALLALLEKCFGVTAKAGNVRVLQSVHLRAGDDGLTATAGDGDLTLVARTPQIDVLRPGSMLASSKLLQIVRACEDESIVIDVIADEQAKIDSGKAHWELRIDNDAYPEIEEIHENIRRVKKDALADALSRVRPAVAGDNLRPMFMFVQITDGVVRATDGHRLHQVDADLSLDMLLPSRAANEVLRRARAMALDDIEIGETDRCYTFVMDDDLLIASKHVFEYPPVERQMIGLTANNELELQVDRRALLAAVERVSLTADSDTKFLTCTLATDTITVSTLDKMGNSSTETLEAYWPHPPKTFGLNHDFMRDMLSSMKSPQVRVMFKEGDAKRPAPLAFKEQGFVGVMVQLRSDLGDAMRAVSDRSRTAPTGWVARTTTENPAPRRDATLDVEAGDLDSVLEAV